jgi:hypothetical protein
MFPLHRPVDQIQRLQIVLAHRLKLRQISAQAGERLRRDRGLVGGLLAVA